MPDSSTQVKESRTQSNGTEAGTVAPDVTHDGHEISKMLLQKAYDECLAIVGEELQDFEERTRARLNLVSPGFVIDEHELTKKVQESVAFIFGKPTAKVMIGTKRRTNDWNKFQENNFKAIQMELSNCLHLKYLMLIFAESQSPPGVQVSRKETVGALSKRWKECKDALDTNTEESMISTRSTTPMSAQVPIGDRIIPPDRESWKKERKRLWSSIKQSVRISYTIHIYYKGRYIARPLCGLAIHNLHPEGRSHQVDDDLLYWRGG